MRATIARSPNTNAEVSSFRAAARLIFASISEARWQNIAMKARNITEYSHKLDTTLVHIATIITTTIMIMAAQAVAFDCLIFIISVPYLKSFSPYGFPLSPVIVTK